MRREPWSRVRRAGGIALVGLLALCRPGPARAQAAAEDLFDAFRWRNIGPSSMMGRISSLDALDDDFRTVLIGTASGGVWKSTNGGLTVEPIFDRYGSQSIGDVAFFQRDPNIIWVGTGESTNRNSVGWGDGIYKSTDGGATFTRMGLEDTYQISEIAPHPTNPDIVYVAALGNLWGYDGSRGLFKTTDGGRTWEKLTNGLPDDGRTGATDVAIDPTNPDVVYVGMYHRLRRPWSMHSGGPNGGIYKSTDGGRSWRKLTNGLPTGETGQIDIDIYRGDPRIVMAYVEASDEIPQDMSVPGPGVYRSEDGGESWTFQLWHNSRPYYHGRVRIHPRDDRKIYVVARHFYHSEDGGATYEEGKPFSSDGGDDHDLWISPRHDDVFYQATDQGAYLSMGPEGHLGMINMAIGQYYAIGVDMRDPYWVYGGLQDNGGWAVPSNNRNRDGIRADHAIEVNGGDGFHMQVDPTDWRTVYTTAHVGYFGRVDMLTREHTFITPTPRTTINFRDVYDPDFDEDPTNYTINGEERWIWSDIPSRTINGSILPPQFRWNWNSPLVLSPTNPRTVYVGSSHLFKSTDRGETWRIISPDLTKNDPHTRNGTQSGGLTRDATGAENHNTIFTIDQSVLDESIIWVGTDDGNVQVTRDGGATWTNVTGNIPGLPDTIWTSRVEASRFDEATAYVTFDNHRMGDTAPYVYRTTDFGRSWTDITGDLPRGTPGLSVHTIVEDYRNPDLLFLGTEFGVYATVDGGRHWRRLMNGLPPVAVRDLVIHPRDMDLVAGTHGRSIWILDDITPLQQLTPEVLASDVHVFRNRVATKWRDLTDHSLRTSVKFRGENPPRGAAIHFYLREAPKEKVRVDIAEVFGDRVRTLEIDGEPGINRVIWDFRFLPTAGEIEAQRGRLRSMLAHITQSVRTTDRKDLLEGIRKDLLAVHLEPFPFDDAQYRDREDARRLLLDHLRAVGGRLDAAETHRDLFEVREHLLGFSSVVGDTAYFGFYGEELRPTEAPAGDYRIRITVDGRTYEGRLTVREDPLMNADRGPVAAAVPAAAH